MDKVSKIYGRSEILRKTTENLIFLNCFFIASLLIANVVACKVIHLIGLIIPAAVVAYPITFLCTDIIGEIWGKEEANKTVRYGIVIQVFSMLLLYIAVYLPIAPFAVEFQSMFQSVIGSNARFVIASLCAYVVSQSCDVFIFHRLKEKYNGNYKWLRNNLSTMSSQLIDTAIFITIGFYGTVPDLGFMIISQYIVKFILAACDTPFFYFFTRKPIQRVVAKK